MMRIVVGEGSCGIAAGAGKVHEAIVAAAGADGSIEVGVTGCIGMCFLEPIVDIYDGDVLAKRLVRVKPADAPRIVQTARVASSTSAQAPSDRATAIAPTPGVPSPDAVPTLASNNPLSALDDLAISSADADFLEQQTRIALRHCGIVDPTDIEAYRAVGGYRSLEKALCDMTPEEVIAEVKTSGLAGRGGAGFPTWFKWEACREEPGEEKYLICNADEGDPGAFMDRAVIESDPHSLIEGMLIGAYAIGARRAFVYVRAEYPLAVARLTEALGQARAAGLLGDNILGTRFSCDIAIKMGAGAFVCGEETALIESLEGNRGMPRIRPPFPAQEGYMRKPSNINNVETFANVAWIIEQGGAAFSALGTENSKGTKVFALSGKIARGGLVEVPMGTTLHHVIFDIGGGVRDGRAFKAVQMGGPSGGCIPASLLDTRIDYRELAATGAIMGSGGMVVMDETTCMVGMAKFFLDFTARESCGKCVPCRIGTKRMQEILARIVSGQGKEGDVELLEELCHVVKDSSLCGLGQTVPNPVLTTIRYFRDEYEAHILVGRCPAKECVALITYRIDPGKCTGCGSCAKRCPVHAIAGERKQPHKIDADVCIRCGQCKTKCRFDAIEVE